MVHSILFSYFKRPLRNKRNIIILITGKPGTGKSYTGVTIGEEIDPTFTVDRVCFTAREFLNVLNDEHKLKKGSAIILDEVGVMAGARTFQSDVNQILSHVFQIFRHRQLMVILTVPHEKMIDVHLRMSTDYRIQTQSINMKKKLVKAKVFEVKMLHGVRAIKSGQSFYEKIPRAKINGVIKKLSTIYFPKPSKELCRAYELKAKKYKLKVVMDRETKLKAKEHKEKVGKVSRSRQIIIEIKKSPKEFMTEKKGQICWNRDMILRKYDISGSSVSEIVKKLGVLS